MIPLSSMAMATPPDVRWRAKNLRIRLVSVAAKSDDNGTFKEVIATVASRGKTSHSCILRLYYGGGNATDSLAWVSCDCEYFKYTLVVALAVLGSSSGGAGGYPKKKNPSLSPHLCKHIFALIPLVTRIEPMVIKTGAATGIRLPVLPDHLNRLMVKNTPKTGGPHHKD